MLIQASLVSLAILIPMVRPDALPDAHWQPSSFMLLVPVGHPPGPAPATKPSGRATRPAVNLDPSKLVAPSAVPDRVTHIVDEAGGPPSLWEGGGGENTGRGGDGPWVAGGLSEGSRSVIPPPPVVRPEPVKREVAAAAPVQRITLGGVVLEGKLVHKVIPDYPPLAKAARISGAVRLIGIVGTDGVIRKLDVVSGHPLLVEAALRAVRKWVYRPTMLNGSPVEVVAPIDVTFVLTH
ncbi:MAG: energy transducer TonB [Acidobacteriales bacterium]|nr:energy transducer TonB [Terriglobales bacterium]